MSGIIWSREEWHSRMQAHVARVAAHADAFVERRSREAKHPVHDFLFTYYSFTPAKLKQWVPPLGVGIETTPQDLESCSWLQSHRFIHEDNIVRLDAARFGSRERELAAWVAMLCERILDRPGRFTCFGMHEWAMVYRQPAELVRHQGYELRLSPAELATFVETMPVCCSHYDAFRFFTPEARPLNSLQPTLQSRPDLEQPGCLHANMDLYKWSSKLWPWTGSDLIGECFEHAVAGRELDMRASPYDLRDMGCEPVKIETPEGRAHYEDGQRRLAGRAAVLRQRLRDACLTLSTASVALVAHSTSHLFAQADEGALRQV
ncbi:MAG: hypothetical protein U1F71_24110 [Verrucomicrobiaceae bacterium]